MPLKRALTVSENEMASGILSDMPMVSGLGPREEPIGMDVVWKVAPLLILPILSALFIDVVDVVKAGL